MYVEAMLGEGMLARRHAFTLIEVLMVVAIMGLAGMVVVPQMLNASSLGVQAAARAVVGDTLYLQSNAIASQRERQLRFNVGENWYGLYDISDSENPVMLEANWVGNGVGDNTYRIDFGKDSRFEGVSIVSANFGGNTYLDFDSLGSPLTGGNVLLQGDGFQIRVSIAPFTGRVTISQLE